MEILKDSVIVVTPDYDYIFVKSNKKNIIGEMILFDETDIIKNKKKNLSKYMYIAASIVFITLCYILINRCFPESDKVYAYVEYEGIESFKVYVDKDFNVTKSDINKYNNKINIDNKSIKYYITEEIRDIIKEEIIGDEGIFIVTVSANSVYADKDYLESLKEQILYSLELSDIKDECYIYSLSDSERKRAESLELTMAEMKFYDMAIDKNIDISIEKIKKENMKDLLEKIQDGQQKVEVTPIEPEVSNEPNNVLTGEISEKNTSVDKEEKEDDNNSLKETENNDLKDNENDIPKETDNNIYKEDNEDDINSNEDNIYDNDVKEDTYDDTKESKNEENSNKTKSTENESNNYKYRN
jgi:hypothetical protein